jgi:N utilization substance protein A
LIGQLLVTEGFAEMEEVAYVPIEELTAIEGFDEELAAELSNRARTYLEKKEVELQQKRVELGVTDELAAVDGLTSTMLVVLGENEIKTLDDFADLAGDELLELLGVFGLNETQANEMIMAARAHWFEDEDVAVQAENSVVEASENASESAK